MKINKMIGIGMCMLLTCACSDDNDIDYKVHVKEVTEGYEGYKLVWAEEFETDGLPDETYWGYEEGLERNHELQDYRVADLKYTRVEDGKLILEAHPDPHEGINKWTGEPYQFEYSSGGVNTRRKVPFKYGRIDIAAKIPTGRGIWPAIWMMPVDSKYGGWPKSGEIDIMEYVWGHDEEHNTVHSTIHTEDTDLNGNRIQSGTTKSNTLETAFHLYSLVWKKSCIEILFDNKVIFTYDRTGSSSVKWPFDQEFYLILNVAVGGSWGGGWGIDESMFPKRMEVEYVRYYEQIDPEPDPEPDGGNNIKNGSFEEEPEGLFVKEISGTTVLDYLDCWYTRTGKTPTLQIDETAGANGSSRSLKLESKEVKESWDIDLAHPIGGVDAGKYTFSFYLKTNKEDTPFTASITFCENEEDIAQTYQMQKSIVIRDGVQSVQTGPYDIWATLVDRAGTEWKKYSVTVDLPQSVLVKFVFKPCTTAGDSRQWYTTTYTEDVIYWFDDLSFILTE